MRLFYSHIILSFFILHFLYLFTLFAAASHPQQRDESPQPPHHQNPTNEPPPTNEPREKHPPLSFIHSNVLGPAVAGAATAAVFSFSTEMCGISKGCLFKPPNCTPYVNCSYALSYTTDSHRLYMELLAEVVGARDVYVAVGFSADGLMGNDTVTDCASFAGARFVGGLSYNPGQTNRRVPIADRERDEMLTLHYASYAEGILYCRISQTLQPATDHLIHGNFVRPLDVPYTIIMASGNTIPTGLTIHSLDLESSRYPLITEQPLLVTAFAHAHVDFHTLPASNVTGGRGQMVGSAEAVAEAHGGSLNLNSTNGLGTLSTVALFSGEEEEDMDGTNDASDLDEDDEEEGGDLAEKGTNHAGKGPPPPPLATGGFGEPTPPSRVPVPSVSIPQQHQYGGGGGGYVRNGATKHLARR